ncbi:MAG: hypothetical protein N3F05_02815 [Candidatus Diapherotrites archaeon]|nr:hypothetical protein [Candidatus Diapherotrites archaeon]
MMSMWGKTKEKKDRLCIPEHQKVRIEKTTKPLEEELKPLEESKSARALFSVTDSFQLHELSVIKGTVTKGTITKKDKILLGEKPLRISELWINEKKVDVLHEGDSGAIFINSRNVRVAPGDVLEIE